MHVGRVGQRLQGLGRRGIGGGVALAQRLEGDAQAIGTVEQLLHLGSGRGLARDQVLDRRFQPVRQFTQAHRAGQPCAALERMQRAHAGGGVRHHLRQLRPVAQVRGQFGQQLLRLFLEDRKQVEVDHVDRVDVLLAVERGAADRPRRVDEVRHEGRVRGLSEFGEGARARQAVGRLLRRLSLPRWQNGQRHRLGRRHERCGHRQRDWLLDRHFFLLRRRECRQALGHLDLVGGQSLEQLGRRRPQEAGRELVQEPTYLVGHVVEQPRVVGASATQCLRVQQRVLELSGQRGEIREAHRRRAAGQRMRQRDRRLADRPLQFERPFGQLSAEAAREFVGLVQIDVEQRDADVQGPDDLELIVVGPVGFVRLGSLGKLFDLGHLDQLDRLGSSVVVRGLQDMHPVARLDQRGLGRYRFGRRHAFLERLVGRDDFEVRRHRHLGMQGLDQRRNLECRARRRHVELERGDQRLFRRSGVQRRVLDEQRHRHRRGDVEFVVGHRHVDPDDIDERLELVELHRSDPRRIVGRCGDFRRFGLEAGGRFLGLHRRDGRFAIAQIKAEVQARHRPCNGRCRMRRGHGLERRLDRCDEVELAGGRQHESDRR